jgi:hypothetical protein
MEIGNFAMAKGLQCVLALFPRNNRFSESFSSPVAREMGGF